MIDLPDNQDFIKLVQDVSRPLLRASLYADCQFYAAKKPVSAVCHGPAALVNVKTPSGDSILKGAKVTVFSNSEESQTPYNDFVNILPFSPQDRLNQESGGNYVKADDWAANVVWDKGILTGKSPSLGLALIDRSEPQQCRASREETRGDPAAEGLRGEAVKQKEVDNAIYYEPQISTMVVQELPLSSRRDPDNHRVLAACLLFAAELT
jgi:hypothetical protein